MKNILEQAPSWATYYDAKSYTYNDRGIGFSITRLSTRTEFLICLALVVFLLFAVIYIK